MRKKSIEILTSSYLKVKYARLSARNCWQACSEHAGTQGDRYKSVVPVCNLLYQHVVGTQPIDFLHGSRAATRTRRLLWFASICSNRR